MGFGDLPTDSPLGAAGRSRRGGRPARRVSFFQAAPVNPSYIIALGEGVFVAAEADAQTPPCGPVPDREKELGLLLIGASGATTGMLFRGVQESAWGGGGGRMQLSGIWRPRQCGFKLGRVCGRHFW